MRSLKTPISKRAQVKVKTAVDNGKLFKPDTCEECGIKPSILHGHHEDYSKPLMVIWLCPSCHAKKHFDPSKQKLIPVQVRLEKEEYELLKKLAKEEDRSLGGYLRLMFIHAKMSKK